MANTKLLDTFIGLPEKVRNRILSNDIEFASQEIGAAHKLSAEKSLDLEDEIMSILLGETHPKEFVGNLSSKLSISSEEAVSVAKEVNEIIFAPIKKELAEMHGIGAKKTGKNKTVKKKKPEEQINASNSQYKPEKEKMPPSPPTPPMKEVRDVIPPIELQKKADGSIPAKPHTEQARIPTPPKKKGVAEKPHDKNSAKKELPTPPPPPNKNPNRDPYRESV